MSLGSGKAAFPEHMKGRRIGMPDANSLVTRLALVKLRSMKIYPQRYFASIQTFNDAEAVIGARQLGLIDAGVPRARASTLERQGPQPECRAEP